MTYQLTHQIPLFPLSPLSPPSIIPAEQRCRHLALREADELLICLDCGLAMAGANEVSRTMSGGRAPADLRQGRLTIRIHRFELEITDYQELSLPLSAHPLSVGLLGPTR